MLNCEFGSDFGKPQAEMPSVSCIHYTISDRLVKKKTSICELFPSSGRDDGFRNMIFLRLLRDLLIYVSKIGNSVRFGPFPAGFAKKSSCIFRRLMVKYTVARNRLRLHPGLRVPDYQNNHHSSYKSSGKEPSCRNRRQHPKAPENRRLPENRIPRQKLPRNPLPHRRRPLLRAHRKNRQSGKTDFSFRPRPISWRCSPFSSRSA